MEEMKPGKPSPETGGGESLKLLTSRTFKRHTDHALAWKTLAKTIWPRTKLNQIATSNCILGNGGKIVHINQQL